MLQLGLVKASIIVTAVALVVGLASGFLTWVTLNQITTSTYFFNAASYSLVPDVYRTAYTYSSQGANAVASMNSLGATLANAPMQDLILLGVVLLFWPAMLVSGLITLARRRIRVHAFIYGVIAVIAALVIRSDLSGQLGVGLYVSLGATILFLIGWMLWRSEKVGQKQNRFVPSTAPPSTTTPPPPATQQPPKDPWST